jgi:acyl dehydratase
MQFDTFEEMAQHVGSEVAVSDWLTVTQERVTAFAHATDDPDWMHIDVDRARQGPLGTTIAQGFLTLSMLLFFTHQTRYRPENIDYALNYGLNRVRWITPVRVGARIRNRTVLKAVTPRASSRYLITTINTVEIEGAPKPAMVAEWLGLAHVSD